MNCASYDGRHDRSHPQLELDAQLCFPLYAARAASRARYAELLAEVGLTYPQYLTMLALWDADAPLTVGEIGDASASTPAP